MKIRHFLPLLALAVILGLWLGHQAVPAHMKLQTATTAAPRVWEPTDLPPCPTEDSRGPCYWDAGSSGNGRGFSFWVDRHQRIHYIGLFRSFGYHWQPVWPALADVLSEGGTPNADTRRWERCVVRIASGHNRKAPLVCPDGLVIPDTAN